MSVASNPQTPPLFLDKHGRWFHEDMRIDHLRMAALLHRSIARDESGQLVVTTGRDVEPFVAEDAPYVVRSVELTTPWTLILSDGSTEALGDLSQLTLDAHGVFRSRVKDGRFWARWGRGPCEAATHHLDFVREDDDEVWLTTDNQRVRVQVVDHELEWST